MIKKFLLLIAIIAIASTVNSISITKSIFEDEFETQMKDMEQKLNENIQFQIKASNLMSQKLINESIANVIHNQEVINKTISSIDQRTYNQTSFLTVNGIPVFYNGNNFINSMFLEKLDQNATETAWSVLRNSFETTLENLKITELNLKNSLLNFL
ncbi:hypothetical protein BpHYR1_010991 [Brachionus plicatilis]|uniref:Uncharacterized protein n=1 Tax=Brachionus plicatilis TaxID=10195 RepID=A0A3M7PEL1_BRAPC|nr:hypothetical protein BpHYR1_010991 [Brachionus plicatilis]